jgi:hypothetical protein
MKKKLFVVLVVTLALGLLSIQAFAGPPEDASGDLLQSISGTSNCKSCGRQCIYDHC